MKKLNLLALFVICSLLLSACWDKHELEDNTFAVLLGIDAADNKNVIVTVAFPQTQTQGGGLNEGMDNGSGKYSVMSAKAPTVSEGLNMFSTKLSGPLALYSVKTIVISQEIAQSDMLRSALSSWQCEEIRNTAAVLISESKAAAFIDARIKNAPIDPLRQEELLLEQINEGAYYKPIQLLAFMAALKSDSGDGVAMYGGISPENQENQEGQESQESQEGEKQNENQGDKQGDKDETSGTDINETVKNGYLPGEVPISATNGSRVSGLAVFRGAKMVGVLDSMEAQTYSMLTQSTTKKLLTLEDPLDPKYDIVVGILPSGKNSINGVRNDDIPVFNIDINLKCTIENIQSGIDYRSAQNYDILTNHINNICNENMTNLLNKIQKEYKADILKLGDKLAYHFITIGEWERYDWPEKYKEADIKLNTTLNIERNGLMS